MFTQEGYVVIKFLRQNKSYSAGRLVKEFLLKHWKSWRVEQISEENYIDSDIKHFMFTSQVMKLMITG